VGGRTRVFLLWKGVDVLLGKTFNPQPNPISPASSRIQGNPLDFKGNATTNLVATYPESPTKKFRFSDSSSGDPGHRPFANAVMAAADFQAISLVTFLWGLAKKITRLPAGTGEVALKSLCFNF
jgi:hypothetical protein